MQIIIFDHPDIQAKLKPLTFTRSASDLLIGCLTIKSKWSFDTGHPLEFYGMNTFGDKYHNTKLEHGLFIIGALVPDSSYINDLLQMKEGEAWTVDNCLVAFKGDKNEFNKRLISNEGDEKPHLSEYLISRPWHIFKYNSREIINDSKRLDMKPSMPDDPHTVVYGKENLYLGNDVDMKACIINAENGPVIINDGAKIGEGAVLQSPLYIGKDSVISPGAKIRSGTSIGPHCKVGGEVNNVIFLGYSNKAHDGFLGNSVIGEWCNFGADSNCSNLKNTYSFVKLYSYFEKRMISTEETFCGLIMGDHCKSAINSVFNTGTVAGVHCNIFGLGFPPKHIESFSWGYGEELKNYTFDVAMKTAEKMMARRGKSLSASEIKMYEEIYNEVS